MTATLASWTFTGTWRRYQQECLDAFEADRASGHHQTLLVAPPGSGKTVIGPEIVRRLGAPTLVLCPTQTIQSQWQDKQALFGERSPDVHALTYQSLCQTGDPDDMLRTAAQRQWAGKRVQATGDTAEEVEAEVAAWTGEAAARRDRDLVRIAGYKRSAARGRFPELTATELLAHGARADRRAARGRRALRRPGRMPPSGVHVGRADEGVLAELSPDHVLGLTATNPSELTAEQASLYRELLDEEDYFIPTRRWCARASSPRTKSSCNCALLCSPSTSGWPSATPASTKRSSPSPTPRRPRAPGPRRVVAHADRRAKDRGRRPAVVGRVRKAPAHAGLGGAALAEAHRSPVDSTRCRWLGDLGYTLTRQGIRRSGGEVDRVLLSSAAKPMAMCEALSTESDARGPALRAVVLCDSERPPRQPEGSPLALTGGGRGLLAAIGADDRLTGTRPALVTGETFAVLPSTSSGRVQRGVGDGYDLRVDEEDGIAVLRAREGAAFTSRAWTDWATRLLAAGETQTLLGTRGLLGEGWDCPR